MLEDTMKMLHETIENNETTESGIRSSEENIVVSANEEETKLFWAVELPGQMTA